jgi:hypothetical protein
MWWHTDLPAVPAGFPAQTEAPPGAVPGEELLFLIDLRANELMSVLLSLIDGAPVDDPPPFRLPSPGKSD